jgi:orotate phosphoribosyltransferase
MPIYNDNRMLLADPKTRKLISEGFSQIIKKRKINFDVVAGTSTAGIPHAETLADKLEKPMIYIRDKPKDHGLRNQIEGIDSNKNLFGLEAIIVEDLVSTGGSSLKAVQAVRNARGKVKFMLSIFNYGFPETEQEFSEEEVKLESLLTYDTLLKVGVAERYISESQLKTLEEWRKDPFNWGEKHGFPKGEKKSLKEKWLEAVKRKNSILCVGLDPAEYGQRAESIYQGFRKIDWCLEFITIVAPFAAAIKPNRNYIKDLKREDVQIITKLIHDLGMISIDDSKLVDIGETNDSGFYHAQSEGFDAVTYSPFPGNMREAVSQAHTRGLALIPLVLMSNPEFEAIKNSRIRGFKGYEYFALQAAEYNADAIVIGAPSPTNHLKKEEVERVKEIVGDKLVLMPGVGAQGGDAKYILEIFGKDNVIANVGRAIAGKYVSEKAAEKYQKMLNELRAT